MFVFMKNTLMLEGNVVNAREDIDAMLKSSFESTYTLGHEHD